MKTASILLVLVLTVATASAVEYVTLRPGQSKSLQPSDLVDFTLTRTLNNSSLQATIVFEDDSSDVIQLDPGGATYTINFQLTGIKQVSIQEKGLVTLKITSAEDLASIPSSVVTLPADVGQGYTVTLQESGDLSNWNAVAPGSFTGESSPKFFRVLLQKVTGQ